MIDRRRLRIQSLSVRDAGRAKQAEVLPCVGRSPEGDIHISVVVECNGFGRMPVMGHIVAGIGEDDLGFAFRDEGIGQLVAKYGGDGAGIQVTVVNGHPDGGAAYVGVVSEVYDGIGLAVAVQISQSDRAALSFQPVVEGQLDVNVSVVVDGDMSGSSDAVG